MWFQRAKEMVLELLAEKDMQGPGGGMGTFNNFDGMGHGGGGGPGGMEVWLSFCPLVGLVIVSSALSYKMASRLLCIV